MSTIIYEPPPRHECELPPVPAFEPGTVVVCDECDTAWVLKESDFGTDWNTPSVFGDRVAKAKIREYREQQLAEETGEQP